MPSSVFKIVLFLSTLSLCAGEEGLEDPTVTLVCNATDKRFEINVAKNGHEYVGLYAPNYENHSGDSRCWKYDNNESETNTAFDFQLEVNSVDKDDPQEDVDKPQPCGLIYRADSDSYYFEFYVSTTEMILTSSAIYYNATCSFSTDQKRYTVSDSISNQDEQYDRTRTGNEKDPNIRNVALNDSDDGASVGISLHVYSLEDEEYTNSLSVGDQIRLVVLDSTSTADDSNNGVQTLQLFAECTMYSDDQRSNNSKYVLTDYTGCAVKSNKLFSGSLQLYDFDETPSENIGNASTFGFMTPEFETPYYSSSVSVYFECLVDRCTGDECIAEEPDCSNPDSVDENSDAISQDSVQYSPAEYMQYTQQANYDTLGKNEWYEEEQENVQDFEDYKKAAHRSGDSSKLIRSNVIFVSGLPRHALTDPYLYSSGGSKDYNQGTLGTRRNYQIEEQSRAMEAIKFILVITMILSILVTSLIAAAYILKRMRRPTGGWDKQMVV